MCLDLKWVLYWQTYCYGVVLGFGMVWFYRSMPTCQRHCHQCTKPRGTKTEDNTDIILTAMRTSNLTYCNWIIPLQDMNIILITSLHVWIFNYIFIWILIWERTVKKESDMNWTFIIQDYAIYSPVLGCRQDFNSGVSGLAVC